MPRMPQLTARELVQFLTAQGFVEDRRSGSHLTLWHEGRRVSVTIPVHTGTDLGRGLAVRILKDAGFSVDDFVRLRSKRRSHRPTATHSPVYQLEITLEDVYPPIWRRLKVPGSITLGRLHSVIQAVMGWDDDHLHAFTIGARRYGVPDRDDELQVHDESAVTLQEAAPRARAVVRYVYDFGDSWRHKIVVESIETSGPPLAHPVCLGGARRCPPEDCGGPVGYASFLEALRDRDHPDHNGMLEWAGGVFDPEAFDLVAVNERLRQLRTQ